MKSAVPVESSLERVVDLEMSSGTFPSSGAVLTFTVTQPVPTDKTLFIASWDAKNLEWVPLHSDVSTDRTTVSAKLEHFSTYGLFDIVSNTIGKLVGVRTTPPECQSPPPAWDDNSVQFYDDINGPVLWCATSDPDNPDNLEIRLKLNRGAAASITTAIKPVWSQSDLWQGVTPETWASMVLSGPESLIPNPDTYFIQPTGEFAFRFNKSDLLKFWHSNRTKPLIEVDTTVPDVLAGLLLHAVSDNVPGGPALFLTTAAMAVSQCSSDIYGVGGDLVLSGTSSKSVVSKLPVLMGVLASCLAGQKEFVAQAAARYWATRDPTANFTEVAKNASLAVKSVVVSAQIYATVQVLAPVADALTDLLLDPIARQFIFQPSDQALKAFLGPAPTDLGSVIAPAMCQRASGKLVNGELPIPKTPGAPDPGFTILYRNRDGSFVSAVGDSSSGTQGLTALVFGCGIGGVGWPATVAVYDARLQLLASFNLIDIDHKEHSDVETIRFENRALNVDWRTNEDAGGGACEPNHETGRFVLSGSQTLTPLDVHVVSRDSCGVHR